MKKIYIVNGLPESGKTTFGKVVGDELREKGIDFLHASSIDPVKKLLRPKEFWDQDLIAGGLEPKLSALKKEVTLVDWDGETKDEHWRKVMSDFKAKITGGNPDLIHHLVLAEFKQFQGDYVGFVDIREPENIEAFIKHANKYRPNVQVFKLCVVSDRAKEYLNRSDMSISETKYDIIFENPRTIFVDDWASHWLLRGKAREFVELEVLDRRVKERFY